MLSFEQPHAFFCVSKCTLHELMSFWYWVELCFLWTTTCTFLHFQEPPFGKLVCANGKLLFPDHLEAFCGFRWCLLVWMLLDSRASGLVFFGGGVV